METVTIIMVGIMFLEVNWLVLRNLRKQVVKKSGRRQVLVDTSTLIDGRILAVAKSGFLGDDLVVTRSVLNELQLLADGSDNDKRTRARFGLDVVRDLQKVDDLNVIIFEDGRSPEGVDNRLRELAKEHGYYILTNDFNLNKVAAVDGTQVLNINNLSQNLRSEFLPGDKVTIELKNRGSERGQAVGYLPDGTMVVVGNAVRLIGKKVEVEVVRYLQTAAGKMMFAKKNEEIKGRNGYIKKHSETAEDRLVDLANH